MVSLAARRRMDRSDPASQAGRGLEETMWKGVGWMCALVGMSCNALPDVAVIQTAYEREASSGSKLHDKDLQVLETKCHDDGTDRYLCEVTFVSRSDPSQRLFFDIVAVARAAEGWELKSGLCKR
jgi:hypothetical protein